MSILYYIFTLFLPAYILKLAVMMDWFTFNWTECTLTVSISLLVSLSMISCSTSCTALLFLLMQTLLKSPVLLHSMYTLPYAGHCLGWWKLQQYLHACHARLVDCAWVCGLSLWIVLDTFILSNSFCSIILFIASAWALCAFTLFAHVRTLPLEMWSLFLDAINSLIISPNMSLSLSPWINCSLSCLSNSW